MHINHHINIITLLLLVICLVPTEASGQRRRRNTARPKAPAVPATQLARQAIDAYDFHQAEQLLTAEIAALSKKRKPTAEAEALLDEALRLATKLRATEQVCFIDSVVVNVDQAIRVIALTRESGRIDTYASTYHVPSTSDATIYENELANRRLVSVANQQGQLRLALSDKVGDDWGEPIPLQGLNADDVAQNFPFLLSDGITLYFAAKGPASIGGYDIFVTRIDPTDSQCLQPDNLGFPFCSTANDYLLAIDELAGLGWLVTDRRQPKGKVCVYTFIPNTTRTTYSDDIDPARLRRLAQLTSIAETQVDADAVAAARERLANIRSGVINAPATPDFTFIINDDRTYTSLTDFHSDEAVTLMKQWLQLRQVTDTDATLLQRLRDQYAEADPSQRVAIGRTITRLEATHYSQLLGLKALAKDIRNAELRDASQH